MRTRTRSNKTIRCRNKNIPALWIDLWIKKRKGKSNTVGMKEAEYEKNIKQDNDKSWGKTLLGLKTRFILCTS